MVNGYVQNRQQPRLEVIFEIANILGVKPTDLMRYLCRLVTPPNGIVLDPFLGSGTTAIAAQQEGFRYIGMERDAEYCAIAMNRINKSTAQADIFREDT